MSIPSSETSEVFLLQTSCLGSWNLTFFDLDFFPDDFLGLSGDVEDISGSDFKVALVIRRVVSTSSEVWVPILKTLQFHQ